VQSRTVGVEEEFLLVTGDHEATSAVASQVLRVAAARGVAVGDVAGGGFLVHELQEQQLEATTTPQVSMAALETELRRWRHAAAAAAAEVGARLVASATAPVRVRPTRVRTPRYDRMAERFGIVADEQLTCGCHVHVSVESPEEAVGVLDRIRVWLPTLLALSANSPYWQGHDTGYASFRALALGRWPVTGPTELFGTPEHYRAHIDRLLAAGVILDEAMVYFDARRSHRYPTVEVRVPDVCLDPRDTVLVAALSRALVATAAQEWAAGEPPPPVPASLLRLATWHAAHAGLGERLLDPLSARPRLAATVLETLLEHVGPALRCTGDEELVSTGISRLLERGSGAVDQRAAFARRGRLSDVVEACAVGMDPP
jgi:carboxylate-amine ligase